MSIVTRTSRPPYPSRPPAKQHDKKPPGLAAGKFHQLINMLNACAFNRTNIGLRFPKRKSIKDESPDGHPLSVEYKDNPFRGKNNEK